MRRTAGEVLTGSSVSLPGIGRWVSRINLEIAGTAIIPARETDETVVRWHQRHVYFHVSGKDGKGVLQDVDEGECTAC